MPRIEDTDYGLSIPGDVLKQCAWITILGRRELTIEGHGGILHYEEGCIRIRLKHEVLSVKGRELVIDYYNDEEVKVIGCIEMIQWDNR